MSSSPHDLLPNLHRRPRPLIVFFALHHHPSQCDSPTTGPIQLVLFLSQGSVNKVHTLTGMQRNSASTLMQAQPQQGYPMSKSILNPTAFLSRVHFDPVTHFSTSACLSEMLVSRVIPPACYIEVPIPILQEALGSVEFSPPFPTPSSLRCSLHTPLQLWSSVSHHAHRSWIAEGALMT